MRPAYQERVLEERSELKKKLDRLTLFLNTPEYQALPSDERDRLSIQQAIMKAYENILDERINAWEKTT